MCMLQYLVVVAVKVTDSPSQKSVLLNAVELKLILDGFTKFTISKVILLLVLDVSVTPTGEQNDYCCGSSVGNDKLNI